MMKLRLPLSAVGFSLMLSAMLAGVSCEPEPKATPAPTGGAAATGGSPTTAAAPAGGESAPAGSPAKEAKFVAYASFYPLAYFAERIGGEHVTVRCAVPADADPAHWMPPPEVVREMQQADVVLVNGAGFEKWLDKVSLHESRLVNTTEAIAEQYITLEHAVKHSHGPAGEHAHEGLDGHTWVDPRTARVQAEAVLEAFLSRYPAPSEAFQANFEKLAAELEALAARAEALSPRLAEQVLLASHPAYNYLARQFHWNVHSLALDPQSAPAEEEWKQLSSAVSAMPAILLLWEKEPKKEIADRLFEEFGLISVVFDPCETADPQAAEQDYIKRMHANYDRIEAELGPPAPRNAGASD